MSISVCCRRGYTCQLSYIVGIVEATKLSSKFHAKFPETFGTKV